MSTEVPKEYDQFEVTNFKMSTMLVPYVCIMIFSVIYLGSEYAYSFFIAIAAYLVWMFVGFKGARKDILGAIARWKLKQKPPLMDRLMGLTCGLSHLKRNPGISIRNGLVTAAGLLSHVF